jgi:hypothetical protein
MAWAHKWPGRLAVQVLPMSKVLKWIDVNGRSFCLCRGQVWIIKEAFKDEEPKLMIENVFFFAERSKARCLS